MKTIHILRWYADEANRRRINRQLNKGEALHSLRSHLCYANQGEIRGQSDQQLRNQVGCLNLVTNTIIIWNAVYMERAVQQLQQQGQVVADANLMHLWPTRHAHINVYAEGREEGKLQGRLALGITDAFIDFQRLLKKCDRLFDLSRVGFETRQLMQSGCLALGITNTFIDFPRLLIKCDRLFDLSGVGFEIPQILNNC